MMDLDYMGSCNLHPTLGSDPGSLDGRLQPRKSTAVGSLLLSITLM